MIEPLPRLQAVANDVNEALRRVDSILDFLTDHPADPDIRVTILNNVIVSLVSIVEEGIRLIFFEYLALIEENISAYKNIRKELADSNIRSASELLLQSLDANKQIDAALITKSLLNCLESGVGFKLFKEKIAYNRNNMRSKEVADLARRVGIRDFWQKIRTQPEARQMFPDSSEEQVEQQLIARWNALFDERDLVVHRISQANGWGETIIRPYIEFIRSSLSCLTNCMADDARAILNNHGSSSQTTNGLLPSN